jgi:hypothetical protein
LAQLKSRAAQLSRQMAQQRAMSREAQLLRQMAQQRAMSRAAQLLRQMAQLRAMSRAALQLPRPLISAWQAQQRKPPLGKL